MAQIEIAREDVEAGTVPAVCIKCGADPTEVQYRWFACYPWQTSVLAFFNVKYEPNLYELEVGLPFCRAHRRYWLWADMLKFILPILLAIPVCLVAFVLCMVLFGPDDSGIAFLVALGGTFVAWLVWNEWRDRRTVRAVRIDAADIVLGNVADEVARQWETIRRGRDSNPR